MSSVLSFFPNGLRIIVIDSDEASLNDVVQKLQEFKYYTVTPCTKASSALDILNHARGAFDLLFTEVCIEDMDGLSLLRHVRENFEVPIVIMSAKQKTELAVECLNSGACFYLDKPVECSVLATIWQHAVVTRRPNMCIDMRKIEQVLGQPSSCSVTGELINEQGKERMPGTSPTEQLQAQEEEHRVLEVEVEQANADDHDEEDDHQESTSDGGNDGGAEAGNCEVDVHVDDEKEKKALDGKLKKPKKSRVVWTGELHQLFLEAIEKLGIDKACPRKILELMNRPELTRAHVASHLQKYRQYLRRKAEGKKPGTGRASRFPVRRRKSVFDSAPNKPMDNLKNQMDMTNKAPAPASYTTTPQSTFDRFSASSSASSTISTIYMGFSLAPQQQQNQCVQGLGNTQPRSDFFGFQSQGSFSGLSSYGMHYASEQCPQRQQTPAFSTMPTAGSIQAAGSLNVSSLLGNTNNNNATATLLTRDNPLDMSGFGLQSCQQPANATGHTTNYVGLQIEPTTGQLGFGPNSSVCSSDLFSQDVTSEPNMGIDYDFLDQFIQADLPIVSDHKGRVDNNTEKSLEVQATPKQTDSSICLGQNDSSINCSNILPAEIANVPPEHIVTEQQNRISSNDFTGIGFDLEEGVTFESFTSLLFDQQEHDGVTLAETNTNFAGAGDDKQGEDQTNAALAV